MASKPTRKKEPTNATYSELQEKRSAEPQGASWAVGELLKITHPFNRPRKGTGIFATL